VETWIRVIEMFALASGEPHGSSRTRGLPHDACLILVQEVRGPKTIAYCYRDGDKDPEWWPSSSREATFSLHVALRSGTGLQTKWTPTLTEAGCRAGAEQIDPAQGWAYCVRSLERSP